MKIIAEVGSNWSNLDDCKKSIQLAKACGADAVKFQLFDGKSLYGSDRLFIEHNPDGKYFHTLEIHHPCDAHKLPVEWLPVLKEKADAHGIEFMCSAFSPELIEAVDPFVKTHKVASAELTHVRMLEKLRVIGKPVILSTGASGDGDITQALHVLGKTPVTLMYCVAEYPARIINPARILTMMAQWKVPVGFSDHSTDVLCIPRIAQNSGATVIEKHVNFVGAKGPDADYALTTEEFRQMCSVLNGMDPVPAREADMRTRHNRRLIATKHIKAGEQFREDENFGIFRSLTDDTQALTPWVIDRVNGKTATMDIDAGEGIAHTHVNNL